MRTYSKPWTPEQQVEIARWYEEGHTAAQIADHLHIPLGTVKRRLAAMKVFKHKAKRAAVSGIDIKQSRQDEVAELMSQDMGIAEIAKALNITQGAVKCTIRRIKRNLGRQAQ